MSGTTVLILILLSLGRESYAQNNTANCTQNDWLTFLSALPHRASCGPSVIAVLQFMNSNTTDSEVLQDALENVCNLECGGVFVNFLRQSCNDTATAELLEGYCTYTNETSTLGAYCRSTALDVFNKSLLRDLFLCHSITPGVLCSPLCKKLLLDVKSQVGCCYQPLYNNSVILDDLLKTGLLPVVQYYGLQRLREPTFNVWMVCNIAPPEQCVGRPFSSTRPQTSFIRPPPTCALDYVFTVPHAEVCGVSLGKALTPTNTNISVIISDLENVCNSDCGGNYAQHLKNNCKDEISAEILRIICTPAGNDTTVGPYCRFAYGTLYDQTFLGALFVLCSAQQCVPQCKAGLLQMKSQIGCCYHTIYNNTYFLNTVFNAGLISQNVFYGLQKIGNPTSNPWMACNIEPPQTCEGEPFPAILPPPVCSLDNWVAFIPQIPNAIKCGPDIATVFSPPTNSTILRHALDRVCSATCGGVLDHYLRTTCNDPLSSELLQTYCTPTSGVATVGTRCRFASPDVLRTAIISDLLACNATLGSTCSSKCREALINLRSEIGCCYQSMYNNSLLLKVLIDAGFITARDLQTFEYLRSPISNIWTVCNEAVPQKCVRDPFPTTPDCPPGTYKEGSTCNYCPANSNTTTYNKLICPCLKGFFRTTEEGPTHPCSAPPSSCLNIGLMNRTDQQIALRWSRPRETGRDDFYYTISYSNGESTGEHTIFKRELDRIEEIISGLIPATTYRITVTVHNGVSHQDSSNEHLRRCELKTSTREGRPSAPLDVQGFCDVVGWRMPRESNGQLLSYNVHLYTTSEGEGLMETVNSDQTYFAVSEYSAYKQYDTHVQVRAKTSAGLGEWSDEVSLGCHDTPTQQPIPSGVHFVHMKHRYTNNSELSLASIGEGDQALICKTDKEDCCEEPSNRSGEFYYPNGVQVPIKKFSHSFYRTRGYQEIYLSRRAGFASPVGVYRCEILDSYGVTQNIYITLT